MVKKAKKNGKKTTIDRTVLYCNACCIVLSCTVLVLQIFYKCQNKSYLIVNFQNTNFSWQNKSYLVVYQQNLQISKTSHI